MMFLVFNGILKTNFKINGFGLQTKPVLKKIKIMKKVTLVSIIFLITACYKEHISSSGSMSFKLNGSLFELKDVKGQIYDDLILSQNKERYRYEINGINVGGPSLNLSMEAPSEKDKILRLLPNNISKIKVFDKNTPTGSKIYIISNGTFEITEKNKTILKGKFSGNAINQSNAMDILKIEDGYFEINNPEFYKSTASI